MAPVGSRRLRTARFGLVGVLLLAAGISLRPDSSATRGGMPAVPSPVAARMPSGPPGAWSLVADDEFDGRSLNGALWRTVEPWEGAPGFSESADSYCPVPTPADLVSVRDGVLRLTARPSPTAGKPLQSCFVSTRDRFSFTHGFVEARVRLPSGRGLWPAFWLLGDGVGAQAWPRTGEIDIAEFVNNGSDDGRMFSTVHFSGPCIDGHCAATAPSNPGSDIADFSGRWVTIGLARTAGELDVYVDGRRLYSFSRQATDDSGHRFPSVLFDGPMHVRFDLQAGGWGADPRGADQPGTFDIDYVRAWQERVT